MSAAPLPERPTSRRPFSFGREAHLFLGLAAAPLFAAFAWQSTVATVGDDSVSYLVMARWFAGTADAYLTPWLGWHSHFPPLFSLVLAVTGGAGNLLVAHMVVAAFAALAIALVARYAALRLQSDWAGIGVAAAFLLLPTAWISAKGILSETLYLAISMAALLVHETRLARGDERARAYLVFGVLLGLACSTRAIGVTLAAAFVIREAIAAARARRVPRQAWLAVLPAVVFASAWALVRPEGHVYARTIRVIAQSWLEETARMTLGAADMFAGGWMATFLAEGEVPAAARLLVYAVGLVALAGSVRAARRNRLDGWYVLLTAIVVFAWVSGIDNVRRLLYPVVPLALLHAAEVVIAVVSRARLRRPRMAAAAICAAPLLACVPAAALIAEKSLDRQELVPGSGYRARDITDYYQIINRRQAHGYAAKNAATLAGLEALRSATPADARVMWTRPEYVALLGGRAAVAQEYDWDARTLASRIREADVGYLVVASMSKSDLRLYRGDSVTALQNAAPYARKALALASPFTGEEEFVLLRIDRAALDAWLAAR